MQFSPHGNINFSVLERAIVNRPCDAFNEEGIDLLFDAIFGQVERHKLTDWYMIEVLSEEALPTDAAAQRLAGMYALAKERHCRGIKGVVSNVVQQDLLKKLAYQAGLDVAFYSDETDAVVSLSRGVGKR